MRIKWLVECWENGSDYDAGKAASHVLTVTAESQTEAETLGDNRSRRKWGSQEVICSRIK